MKIAFVTHSGQPEIEDDDRPLAEALARRGALVISSAWDDADFDWSSVDQTLLRSPWDYYLRYEEFLNWLGGVESRTRVINPPSVVRSNADKRYLMELSARGLHTVPTAHLARYQQPRLADLCAERGWETVVLKPSISADSWETIRVRPELYEEGQRFLERHLPHRSLLVQPFVRDVEERGEQCLIHFGGTYSHAVRKNSAFQGGRHAGPEGVRVEPGADAIDMACQVLIAADALSLPYARVDLARDEEGRPMLMELELFEPTLFFREKPGSEEGLADLLMP